MGIFRESDRAAVERIARSVIYEDCAVVELEAIRARRRSDARLLFILARARSARGEFEAALALTGEAAVGLGRGAERLLRVEILLDAGRRPEALALLEEARGSDPENIALAGLRLVLAIEEAGLAGAAESVAALPPGVLWSPPVLARLLLALEREIGRRLETLSAADALPLHQARSSLFRPRPDRSPRFWFDGLRRFFWSAERRELESGKDEIVNAAAEGDLGRARARAAALLETCGDVKDARRSEALLLSLECAFLDADWAAAERFHSEWTAAGQDPESDYAAALGAYSALAERNVARARAAAAPAIEEGGATAFLLHLRALIEIEEGNLPRAAWLLRLAAGADDLSLVAMVKEETSAIDGVKAPAPQKA